VSDPQGPAAQGDHSLTSHSGPEDDEWKNTIVFSAGTSWDQMWPSERHLADNVADMAPVLFLDPPVSVGRSPSGLATRRTDRLRLIRPGLARFTPLAPPGMTRPLVNYQTARMLRHQLAWAVGELHATVDALVACQIGLRVFGACSERLRVLYGTDDFVAGAELMGLPRARLRSLERDAVREADVVFAVSSPLVDLWRGQGADPILLPNGCDAAAFRRVDGAASPPDVHLPRPIVGFSGHLSDRIDIGLLEAVAATGVSLLLVGPRQRTVDARVFERLLSRPNVQWVGARKFEELPSYLSVMDVGITPYLQTDFNRASFPLKTLEYLAAGLPAVVTDLPAAQSLSSVVRVCSGREEFVRGVAEALHQHRDPKAVQARRLVAEQYSWRERAVEFLSRIREGRPAEA